MKVAVIIDTWFPYLGGGQINAWEISKRLAKLGVEMDIITRNNGKDNLKKYKNLQVYKLGSKSNPQNLFSKILYTIRSFFFLYKKNYDLIHIHAFLPGLLSPVIWFFLKKPTVFTVHGTSIGTNLNNVISQSIEKFILTKIKYNAQITVSQDFLEIKNVNRKLVHIPNGVNIKPFDKIRAAKLKRPTLIFVGRLHPQKNLKNLIYAIDVVKIKIPNVLLAIVGEGTLKLDLQKYVLELKVENNVKFIGQKEGSDLIKLYKSSNIFILPSIYEGQPLSLLEAWAAKLPVIVSKTGDCQYLVKNGKNGYLIKNPDDALEIANLVQKAFSHKNLESLGITGYNFVKKNFSWEKSSKQTLNLYESIAKS